MGWESSRQNSIPTGRLALLPPMGPSKAACQLVGFWSLAWIVAASIRGQSWQGWEWLWDTDRGTMAREWAPGNRAVCASVLVPGE